MYYKRAGDKMRNFDVLDFEERNELLLQGGFYQWRFLLFVHLFHVVRLTGRDEWRRRLGVM